MASTIKCTDSTGQTFYKVRVSAGTGRQLTRTWKPKPEWSERTTLTQLNRYAAKLEMDFSAGRIQTARERRAAAQEAAQLLTVQQLFGESVFLPYMHQTRAVNTFKLYSDLLKVYVFPVLGKYKLTAVTPAQISKLLLDISEKRSRSTVETTRACIRGLFALAVDNGALEISPAEKAKLPRKKKDGHQDDEKKSLSPDEIQRIFGALEEEPLVWRALVTLLADSGMRRGECVALKWADIDFEKSTIHVHRNLIQESGGRTAEGATKTGKARTVDIGQETVAILRQWRTTQASSCISSWVFTRDGTPDPLTPGTVTQWFGRFGRKCDVPGLHPHMLRHAMISNALLAGADLTSVSSRAGHSNVTTTLNVYSHFSEESIRNAGELARKSLELETKKA